MAHKKAGGAVGKNRDSVGKRLGVKVFGGQIVDIGNIIVRQKGTRFHPGGGVLIGKDFTIFASQKGSVKFRRKFGRTFVDVS